MTSSSDQCLASIDRAYRGRLAPTPTGLLHLGHARTFATAARRSREAGGSLVMRIEDLDAPRCKPEFASAALADLAWLGIAWHEGPDIGGPYGPYTQSLRNDIYLDLWRKLPRRRRDLSQSPFAARRAVRARRPHEGDDESIFPPELRPATETTHDAVDPGPLNWRFRVPDGRTIRFHDERLGGLERTAGVDFGDFLIWRKDGFPSYEAAVVADDHAMRITEVVRGEDLLTSTARQLLLYETLGWTPPRWYHCELVRDECGHRLAKRTAALSIAELRTRGVAPAEILTTSSERLITDFTDKTDPHGREND
ncbi:MAG: glutamate--tRNA ligase family protein [Pirellulales bacterium]